VKHASHLVQGFKSTLTVIISPNVQIMFSHTGMTSDSLGQLLDYWTSLKDGPSNRLTKDERQCLLFFKVVSVP
jgi:hypothetical protein